jgi:hypothetical protein
MAAFLVACWKRRSLAFVLLAYVVAVIPKIIAGFGTATIGPIEPSQRYSILLIPVVLLIAAGGATAVGAQCLAWLRLKVGPERWAQWTRWTKWTEWTTLTKSAVLCVSIVLLALALWGLAESQSQRVQPSFREEYRFLSAHLDQLPTDATVATVWLEHLSQRDLDAQLAAPHALLSLARPDIRWVVVGPDDVLSTPDAGYLFKGSTCSLDVQGGLRFGDANAEDRRLVTSALSRCEILESSVEQWIAETEQPASPGTWSMLDGRVALGLGRLR